MSRSLLFLSLILLSLHLSAQTGIKNGGFTIDFGKKKQKQQDSIPQTYPDDDDEDSVVHTKKVKKQSSKDIAAKQKAAYDIHELGIFRGLFHAGMNACQVDGDNEWGYKYLGAEFGAGVMARFHPYVSASMEINYTMKGARARLISTDQVSRRYMVQWDYIEVPIALNAHWKDILMVSAGITPSYMVRYKELDNDGVNVTKNPPIGLPSRLDVSAFAGLHVIIKKHYAIGFKYSYTLNKIRMAGIGTRVTGQYNNVLTFRFMYILGTTKKK